MIKVDRIEVVYNVRDNAELPLLISVFVLRPFASLGFSETLLAYQRSWSVEFTFHRISEYVIKTPGFDYYNPTL